MLSSWKRLPALGHLSLWCLTGAPGVPDSHCCSGDQGDSGGVDVETNRATDRGCASAADPGENRGACCW